MNRFARRLLALALAAATVLGVALALPRLMDAVMAETIGTTVAFAQADTGEQTLYPAATQPPAPTLTAVPTPSPLPTAVPADLLPVEEVGLSPATVEDHSPAVPALSTPVPAPRPGLPTPVGEILPTPLPAAEPMVERDVQPVAWRERLQKGDAGSLPQLLPPDWRELLGELTEEDLERHQVLVSADGVTLAENLLPRNLAEQKLLTGLMDNLKNDAIFVPSRDVLDSLMNLSISGFTVGPQGELATLVATNRIRLPLRVLEYASMNAISSLPPMEYADMRHSLVEQARMEMARTDSPALQRSLDIVSQLMWDDQPWQLAVMGAEPYTPEEGWEYYAFGHHVKAVDMKTGSVYTLTTNLDTERVIGMATEGAQPYLAAYAGWVQAQRQMADSTDPQTQKAAQEVVIQLLFSLSGGALDKGSWNVTHGQGGNPDGLVWYADAFPADAETRMVDPQGKVFNSYHVYLDENLQLTDYYRSYEPIGGTASMGFVGEEKAELEEHVAEIEKEQPGFSKLAEEALTKTDAIIARHLRKLGANGLSYSLTGAGVIQLAQHMPSNGAEPFWTLSVSATVQDLDSYRDYRMQVEVLGPGRSVLTDLVRQ